MFTRIIAAFALALSVVLSAGCAAVHTTTTVTKTVNKDGTTTTETKTETKGAGVSSGAGYYYNPYFGGYVSRQIPASASTATGVVLQEGNRGGKPVLVHRVNPNGQHYQSVWVCPGGSQPIADKC